MSRLLSARFLLQVTHGSRLLVASGLMLTSYMLLAYSMLADNVTGFYWCIAACLCHGCSQAIGEATVMGYLKGLPSDLVMTFGSGTGLSGFFGVLTVLFLNALGLSQGKVSLTNLTM